MCPLCNSKNTALVYNCMDEIHKVGIFAVKEKLEIRRCAACGVTFTAPQLPYEVLSGYFSEEYRSFQVLGRTGMLIRAQKAMKVLTLGQYAGYAPKKWWCIFLYPFSIPLAHFPQKVVDGKVLDIGCGSGNFLAELKDFGWQTYGIDPSPIAVRIAGERGFTDVRQGYIESADFSEGLFDAITMFHVFEHVPNPHSVLEKIHSVLKPDGALIIGVPHFKSLGSFLYRSRWAGLSFPLHYFHYDRASLAGLLEGHGFTVERVTYANLLSDIFVSSPEGICNLAADYEPAAWTRGAWQALNRVFGLLDYAFGHCVAHWLGIGSQITVVARKRP